MRRRSITLVGCPSQKLSLGADHAGILCPRVSGGEQIRWQESNAIGKRFGWLKATLQFNGQFVFHSIRKTVLTILENAGVPENVVANIVGHEKPTMGAVSLM